MVGSPGPIGVFFYSSSLGRDRADRVSARVLFPKTPGGPWSAMGSVLHKDNKVPLLRNLCGSSVLGDQMLTYVSEHVSRNLFGGVASGVRDREIFGGQMRPGRRFVLLMGYVDSKFPLV